MAWLTSARDSVLSSAQASLSGSPAAACRLASSRSSSGMPASSAATTAPENCSSSSGPGRLGTSRAHRRIRRRRRRASRKRRGPVDRASPGRRRASAGRRDRPGREPGPARAGRPSRGRAPRRGGTAVRRTSARARRWIPAFRCWCRRKPGRSPPHRCRRASRTPYTVGRRHLRHACHSTAARSSRGLPHLTEQAAGSHGIARRSRWRGHFHTHWLA